MCDKRNTTVEDDSRTQLEKFKAAARELGTDDDPERFRDTVRKVANAPPKTHADMPKRKG